MRLCLVLPPLTQLNTPYPSTAYLARALRDQGREPSQRDLGLELVLALFSRPGLEAVFDALDGELPEPAWRALSLRDAHLRAVEPTIRFLQGRERTLASRILDTPFLPSGPRLDAADLSAFGPLSVDDAARHLATLYVEDLADLITACIDPGFGLARYQHHLGVGPASFDPLAERLGQRTLVDDLLDQLADSIDAEIVGLSVAFPGNLYGALRIGRCLRERGIYVVMGGGYVNTELRETDEPRLWDYVDAMTFDAGEGPLAAILDWRGGGDDRRHRTRTREGRHDATVPSSPPTCAAWYGDLPLGDYLQLIDTLNPAHRLWADGRWNKITAAHGCYWKKCSFCDTALDYIDRYVPARTVELVDAMEELVLSTGQSGFHLVDEAAPPARLRDLALELIRRDTVVSWWGNIRFERAFTPDLCRLLAASGMIAVTGGLEVASDRLLERMNKGVTVEQVARAAWSFRRAGVMVHAYLMYGFPTQTVQETIDAMELVRQLFAEGLLSSAFWHRFVLTRASPIYREPSAFHVIPIETTGAFAQNDLEHQDPTGADHDRFDRVLPRALASWLRGDELSRPIHTWFDEPMPATTEAPDRIRRALIEPEPRGDRWVWLGGDPLIGEEGLVLYGVDGERVEIAQVELAEAALSGEVSPEIEAAPWWPGLRAAGLVQV